MSDRIIVERLHGHWSASYDGEPHIAFGGADPAEAVDRLVGCCAMLTAPRMLTIR
jgi:hypothetical protein